MSERSGPYLATAAAMLLSLACGCEGDQPTAIEGTEAGSSGLAGVVSPSPALGGDTGTPTTGVAAAGADAVPLEPAALAAGAAAGGGRAGSGGVETNGLDDAFAGAGGVGGTGDATSASAAGDNNASDADAGSGAGAGATAGAAVGPLSRDDSPRPVITAAPGTTLVKVDTDVTYQRFEGWGTSLCWWANHVGGWSDDARDAVVSAVVDVEEGLAYNIFRYNIGGGDDPAHTHMERHRDMAGFQDEDGAWNWDADANQRAVLLSIAAQASGDAIFEAFSNSPPYWMTRSGCASGSGDGQDNLEPSAYPAFADYLTEVVRYYRDEHGIAFRTLEPLNEPNADWWTEGGSQEGCHFDPSSQEGIIRAVAAALADKGLEATVSASDENSMDDALVNLRGFGAETTRVLSQVNVHSYAGSRRTELRDLAQGLGKRLWQSESGPLGQNISDETDAALFMAGRIITDLRDLRPSAWIDWQSGDPSRSWASFSLSDSAQTLTPLKRFYMHAGFSRFIRPGATFVDVSDENMVAALAADQASVTLVIRNGQRDESRRYTFDLTSLPAVRGSVRQYRTSRTEDLVALDPISADGYTFQLDVPAYSITTLVVDMRGP